MSYRAAGQKMDTIDSRARGSVSRNDSLQFLSKFVTNTIDRQFRSDRIPSNDLRNRQPFIAAGDHNRGRFVDPRYTQRIAQDRLKVSELLSRRLLTDVASVLATSPHR